MSKKHFEAIARAIREELAVCSNADLRAGIVRTAVRLACVCAAENPRFDTNRFLAACGIGAAVPAVA